MRPRVIAPTVLDMTPTQLRAFHAVASTGSFTAAARLLHTSQPPITTHVRDLEAYYGVELFHRHGRGAELTAVGRQLLAITQRVVANQEEAVELLRDAGKLERGTLRIGAVSPSGVAAAVGRFRALHRKVGVSITHGNSSELLDGLRRYRLDVAFVGQIGGMEEFQVSCHTRHEIVLLVNDTHRWAKREHVAMVELADEPLIFREEGSNTQRALEEAAAQAGITLACALTYGSREGLVACVEAGLGIGPILADQVPEHPRLHAVRIHDLHERVDGYLACLAERREARMVRAFVEVARSVTASGTEGQTAPPPNLAASRSTILPA
jgi:aminoethylphosphonate catabolism LysR family transcriptional regulator